MTQSGHANWPPLHYRAYLPTGIGVIVAIIVVSALFPLLWLAEQAGTPTYLTTPTAGVVSALTVNVLLARTVVLSGDGRLTVTGVGQHIDVDVRCFTEICVSAGARGGFGFAQVRWNGGGFRMWQAMTYLPDPSRRFKGGRPAGVSEDFRDLVHRLHLINPAMKIRGVQPPAWARPAAN
jgi:hypothetical protein